MSQANRVSQDADTTFSLDNWNLFDFNPLWRNVTLGTPAEREAKMRDPKVRQGLKDEHDSGKGPLANNVNQGREDLQNNADKLFLATAYTEKYKKYQGMELKEIAKETNMHVVDCMLDISLEENLKTSWKTGNHDQQKVFREGIKQIVTDPYVCAVGLSDGGAHTKFITLGEWPTRLLSEVVRDDQMLSLEDAHWKMSKYPAQAPRFVTFGKCNGW